MQRGRVLGSVVAAAIAGACGGPEQGVASRYFSALAAGDHQTLTSFATVRLEEQVEDWEIVGTSEEQTAPVSLPGLAKKRAELKAEFDTNKEAANSYYNDHADDVDSLRDLRQAAKEEDVEPKIPRRLETTAEEWQVFTDKDLELKRAVAQADEAVEDEARITKLSDGTASALETTGGTVRSQDVDLVLTIGGQDKDYRMVLRRYDLDGGGRARWVVAALDPK